jgi:hypothetical protein
VSRPIVPTVNHVFVGVALHMKHPLAASDLAVSCPTAGETELRIYGTTKGESDLQYFRNSFAEPDTQRMVFVGSASRSTATHLLNEAVRISQSWQQSLASTPYFLSRMVVTPLMGRICAKSATEVLTTIQPHLQP